MSKEKKSGFAEKVKTIRNVARYYKDSSPSDYDISMGGSPYEAKEKTILGFPAIGFYILSGIAFLGLAAFIKGRLTFSRK